MEFEGQCKSVGGKLFLCNGDSSISFSSNLFLFYLVFSFEELKLFLDGYIFLAFNLARSTSYSRYISYSCYKDDNHPTFGFLGNNYYGFHGSLFSILGDHCVKFQGEVVRYFQYVLTSLDLYVIGFDELNLGEKSLLLVKGSRWPIRRIVERCSYMILFFETFVIVLDGIAPFENHFLNAKVQLENPYDNHKFLIGLGFLKVFLIEKILCFQFYHLHFKGSMFLLICENKKEYDF
ncbi:hypothetical protein M9H77_31473 [Catharanthus roseus]|uniref:Uncharacterized protein n=1 Tax=Catharanthus roseus TaxID=4058 RepID=A0ACC0A430_CATRO|nr:hypothetical protein M9H77_31473 [Catharanthus roseus]